MMLYPSMASLLERIDSRYLLVNVIAKRSREISEEAEQNDEHLEKKPVSMAIDQLAKGEYTAVPASHEAE